MIRLTDRLEVNGRTLKVADGYLAAIVTDEEASIIWTSSNLECTESLQWHYLISNKFPQSIVTDGTRDAQGSPIAVAKEPSHLLRYKHHFQGLNKHFDNLLNLN